jgi:glycine oxidase
VAKATYQAIEQQLGAQIWYEMPILKPLRGAQEQNDWLGRSALPDYAHLMSIRDDAGDWAWATAAMAGQKTGVLHAARVDLAVLRQGLQAQLQAAGAWIDAALTDPEALASQYDYVICCEGWRGSLHPWFADLDWQLAKGDRLLIRFPDGPPADMTTIYKQNIMLVPVGAGLYWAGSNYDWNFADEMPTEAGKSFILNELHEMLTVPFEVVRHDAAIRPTVKSRRPLIGPSAADPRVFIFNGFGTKGTLLVPFWADYLHSLL